MDLLIAAQRAAAARHPQAGALRPVLIHGQFVRADQLDDFKALGVIPSLFPMHTFYWGDWHLQHTVGPEKGQNISPTGWVLERDMIFTSHHDAPVAFPDSMRVLDATVTRRARGSGVVVGPQHRVDVITALKAMTLWPAYQHFEETTKGSLEVGKLADFVILSADPTAVDPETLDTLAGHGDDQGGPHRLPSRRPDRAGGGEPGLHPRDGGARGREPCTAHDPAERR
jgi:predicted amidohydrolase YtcJ